MCLLYRGLLPPAVICRPVGAALNSIVQTLSFSYSAKSQDDEDSIISRKSGNIVNALRAQSPFVLTWTH